MNSLFSIALCFLCATMYPTASRAQGRTTIDNYNDAIKGAQTVTELGPNMFGDQTNLADGNTEFHVTDVELPTNSRIPMSVGRRFGINARAFDTYGGSGAPGVFGSYWELDVPYMRGTFDARIGWVAANGRTGEGSPQRCGSAAGFGADGAPPDVVGVGPFSVLSYQASDYWNGNQINIPGVGNETLLYLPADRVRPSDGLSYNGGTKSNWRVSCVPSVQNGVGDGYLVRLPNGQKYRFDWMATKQTSSIIDSTCNTYSYCTTGLSIPRVDIYLYATRVEDRFGNWVAYAYDPVFPSRLLSITSNEGNRIDLTYNEQGRVRSVTSGDQSWSYIYSSDLSDVIQPDGSRWSYQYANLYNVMLTNSQLLWGNCKVNVGSMTSSQPPGIGDTASVTVKSPAGATGSFQFRRMIHGTNRTPGDCVLQLVNTGSGVWSYPKIIETPKAYQAVSLYSKSISGPGLVGQNWSFYYEPSWSWGHGACAEAGGCTSTSHTTVTDSRGVVTRHTFGNDYSVNAGQLLETTIEDGSGIRRRTSSSYLSNAVGQPFPDAAGMPPLNRSNPFAIKNRPQLSSVVTQDGVTFTSSISAFDAFVSPVTVTKFSSLGFSRNDNYSYEYNKFHWVLGQLKSLANVDTDTILSENVYNAIALPTASYSFGLLQESRTYNSDGTMASVTDGNDQTTTYSRYKRGIAQRMVFPDTRSITAVVDDSGWVTSSTDPLDNTTGFGYDAMGRMRSVVYPGGDAVAWNQVSSEFSTSLVEEYGIPAGHWKKLTLTGTGQVTTYYDAQWRPMLSVTEDTTKPASRSFVLNRYDVAGHLAFTSFPVASLITVNDTLSGRTVEYDALDRVTRITQHSERGLLVTTTSYLTGFKTRSTNPRGNSSTASYQVFDKPSYDAPVLIEAPAGVTTAITRDVLGRPLRVTRSGPSG